MELYIPFKQLFKFSVLCFFIISGFLLGDKIGKTDSISYYKRRLNATLKPYLVAFSLFVGTLLFRLYVLHRPEFKSVTQIVNFTLFNTLYWYLPNYLVCLLVLMFFKNQLKSLYFGLALLMLNIGYIYLTIYSGKFTLPHTTGMLSYLFYLWLGAIMRKKGWVDKIRGLNAGILLAITVAAYLLSCLESYRLYLDHKDYFNILRFGNQLYSLAMFSLLVKVCSKQVNFGFFNPRQETYGIYLYHGFFSMFLLPKLMTWSYLYFHIQWYSYNIYIYLLSLLLFFAACYLLTVLLVKMLLRLNIGYLK